MQSKSDVPLRPASNDEAISRQTGLAAFEHSADLVAQLQALRAELELMRADRDRLIEQQRRIAELINCENPARLMHDLRNVLNELQLYKTLIEFQQQ